MLELDGLNAGYGKAQVLEDVSITLEKGKVTLIMGTNESGKTTLLKCIAGINKPWSGEITYYMNGKEISLVEKSPEEINRLGISYIPDERAVFPELTVRENLKIGSYKEEARKNFNENLETVHKFFPKLDEFSDRYAGTLSGGEKKMLAVGKGLMSEPSVLLMDEPSLGLAPILVKNVFKNIRDLHKNYGLTILLTEQNFQQSIKIGDKGYILVNGKIEFEGEKEDLKESEQVKRHYLG